MRRILRLPEALGIALQSCPTEFLRKSSTSLLALYFTAPHIRAVPWAKAAISWLPRPDAFDAHAAKTRYVARQQP